MRAFQDTKRKKRRAKEYKERCEGDDLRGSCCSRLGASGGGKKDLYREGVRVGVTASGEM